MTGGPAVDAERVYLGTASGELVALSQETGERVWAFKISPGRVGRITLGNGRLFAGTESGDLVAVLSSNGTREWGYKAEAPILAPPLLCFGRLYVATTSGKVLVMELVE